MTESLCTFAMPAGTTVQRVYEAFRDEILADLAKAMPVDAVLLSLHGAMVADATKSCETDLVQRIRAIVGPKVPVPMSHGACKPLNAVVLGKPIDEPADIERLAGDIEMECMDLLQAAHTWSGIEMALWDILGKKRSEPVYRVLGYDKAYPKLPYASQLFGDTPQQTLEGCRPRARPAFAPSNAAGVRSAAAASRRIAIN